MANGDNSGRIVGFNMSEKELAEKIQLHIPDEKSRRVGQSVAAASLPNC